ncbi:MAG: histidine--tRNA ligase, partial [Deltaproteobacteria bacterium]|nr:histidine--tRNA ligase [Deltaproteobacteria bacterium]
HACAECSEHFNGVKDTLEKMAVTFEINPRMVRGLDYYTKTAFEVTATGLGAQNSVAAGGRYDNLTKELSGPEVPCFGFAIGFERLAMLLNKENFNKAKKVVLIALGDDAVTAALKKGGTLDTLREAGLRVIFEHSEASVKSKMKKANKLGADYVLIIGEDELKEGTVTFKDMEKGEQVKTQLSDIIKMVKA